MLVVSSVVMIWVISDNCVVLFALVWTVVVSVRRMVVFSIVPVTS